MPHALDLPRLDDRPPRYGCGPSFGMLGPSRVLISLRTLPPEYSHLADVCAVLTDQGGDEGSWSATWTAQFADGSRANCSITWSDPVLGSWIVTAAWFEAGGALRGLASRDVHNFTWGFPGIFLEDSAGDLDNATIYRIGEWQTVSERFPAATFPDTL